MKNFFFLFAVLTNLVGFSQQQLSLKNCEDAFQKNNLLLLASQYNITIAESAVIQAKIWELPYINTEINAVNPNQNKYFDIGQNGQKTIAVQQLIYLGGKKHNQINVAKSAVEIAKIQFEQLIVDLKYQLHVSFYNVYFDQIKINNLNIQLAHLNSLVEAYETQADKGNVSYKDLARLQSLSLNFNNELIALQRNVSNEMLTIQIITGISEPITPIVSEQILNQYYGHETIKEPAELLEIALKNNLDYLLYSKIIENNALQIKWQKSLATPDVTLGAGYDQNGGAFHNQVNLTLGIPLPLWNKNKGNIKIAENQLKQNEFEKEYKKLELKNKIDNAYANWNRQHALYKKTSQKTIQNFEDVNKGILHSFQNRNISLLEFTDFLESYNQSLIHINEMRKQLILSIEIINQITNVKVL